MTKKQNNGDIIGVKIKGYKFTKLTKLLFWENKKLINLVFGSNGQGKSSICNIISEAKNNKSSFEEDSKYFHYMPIINEPWKDGMRFKVVLSNKNKENRNNIRNENSLELVTDEYKKKHSTYIRYNNYNFFIYNEKWIDTFKNKINLNEQLFFLDKNFHIIFKKMSDKVLARLYQMNFYLNFSEAILRKYGSTQHFQNLYSNIHNNYCERKKTYDFNSETNHYTIDEYHFKIFEKLLHLSLSVKYLNLESYSEEFFENKIKTLKNEFNLSRDETNNIKISLYENRKFIFDFSLSEKLDFFSKNLIYLDKKINKIFTSFINLIKKNKEEIYGNKFHEIFDALSLFCYGRNTISEYLNNSPSINSENYFNHLIFTILIDKYNMKTRFTNIYNSYDKLYLFIKSIKNEVTNKLPIKYIREICKFINDGLLFVTKKQNYLKVLLHENKREKIFYGKVNGMETHLKNFSTSEKNLLSLVWFFGKLWLDIKNNLFKNIKINVRKNYIIMIDDPISSFDQDNKENVSEYITYYISKIIELTKKINEKISEKLKKQYSKNIEGLKINIEKLIKVYKNTLYELSDNDKKDIEIFIRKYKKNINKLTNEEKKCEKKIKKIIEDSKEEIRNKYISSKNDEKKHYNEKSIEKLIKQYEENMQKIVYEYDNEGISAKFVIFTHDISIYKLFKNNLKSSIKPHENIISYKELKNNNLVNDDDIDLLEYNIIMKKLYFFVTNKDVNREDCIGIGNNVRRVLEFFLYYYRNKGTREIESLKKELKEKNNTKLHNINFTNLTNYLNNESHVDKSFADMNFNVIRDPSYYKSLVKQLFCLIHAIDNKHIINHLKKYESNIESTIQEWTTSLESISSLNE